MLGWRLLMADSKAVIGRERQAARHCLCWNNLLCQEKLKAREKSIDMLRLCTFLNASCLACESGFTVFL